jgi:hypothetical protein
MSETTPSEEYAKVAIFNAKKKDWVPLEEKFLSQVTCSGYKHLILGKVLIPDSSVILDKSKATDKPFIKIRELNEITYGNLITAMDITKPGGRLGCF